MADSVRDQVNTWLTRGLEEYYRVLFIDFLHIKIHHKRNVAMDHMAFNRILPRITMDKILLPDKSP